MAARLAGQRCGYCFVGVVLRGRIPAQKPRFALVPFAMLLVIDPGVFGIRGLAPLMILAIQVVFALFTIGTVSVRAAAPDRPEILS